MADLSHSKMVNFSLTGADLRGAKLEKSQFQYSLFNLANLRGADLKGANLQMANLESAQLQGADLTEANLQGADLRNAILQGTDLRRINLQIANLNFAQLQGANLGGAQLQGANLKAANLKAAYTGKKFKSFVELIGKTTRLSNLGPEKLTQDDFKRIIIKYVSSIFQESCFSLITAFDLEERKINMGMKWTNFIKQAVGKTSLEWLEMQKGKYITGVLTWEEACKIQGEVTSPEVRRSMGLDKVNWKEKCK